MNVISNQIDTFPNYKLALLKRKYPATWRNILEQIQDKYKNNGLENTRGLSI